MSSSTVLQEVREELNLPRSAVARMGLVSVSMVRQVEEGRKRFAPDVWARILEGLGSAKLMLAAARDVTGGMFTSPYLDGESVDLHRCSVAAKLHEEMQEGAAALDSLDLVNTPRQDEYSRRRARDVLLQILDIRVAIDHFVIVVAKEFRINIRELFREHDKKLRERGYIRR